MFSDFSFVVHLLLSQHIYKAVDYSYNFPVWFSSSLMHRLCSTPCVFQNTEMHVRECLNKEKSF